ncbi:MAG: hypothetical protein HFJ36_00200 [Clostridia bacterium]|nr:hypothetical protein [Clostridia bacterium]
MNKLIITMIAIIVVIVASITAVILFFPNREEETPRLETIVSENEEILDDCTEEYEGMEHETIIKANTQEEKTSPNCSVTTKIHYKKCGHTTSIYDNLPQEFVNLTKEEIQNNYQDYDIESFNSNKIELYQEKAGECGEHYMVKDKDGEVAIYKILEDGSQEELEITSITTEYLTETDKINIKNGIQINGKQELNQLIEDYE